MSLHERLKRIEDRLSKLESTATEHAEFIAEVDAALAESDADAAAEADAATGERDPLQSLG